MWLIVLPLMFKLSPPVVSSRDPGSQSLDWVPVPHFCPLEAKKYVTMHGHMNVKLNMETFISPIAYQM
jgi:hypothetical protein